MEDWRTMCDRCELNKRDAVIRVVVDVPRDVEQTGSFMTASCVVGVHTIMQNVNINFTYAEFMHREWLHFVTLILLSMEQLPQLSNAINACTSLAENGQLYIYQCFTQ